MAELGEVADYVRSKNAGPFWVTVDIFCGDGDRYERVRRAPALSAQAVAALYGVSEDEVRIFADPRLYTVKISFPRLAPQGGTGDADSHAGQQFVPLLSAEVD